jgi:multisubunit Na+/H+ antiporter MnhC subunit
MVLIAVLAGLALTLVLVALAMRLYEKYGTLDMDEIKKLKG